MHITRDREDQQAETVMEDKIFVCVGNEFKESELTLSWALHNSGGRNICILHVHQPAQKIKSLLGTNQPISQLEENYVKAYHQNERNDMHKLMEKYSRICERAGLVAETVQIEKDPIEKGILELISLHGIKRIVIGAAADKHYYRRMMEPKSKKAMYVRRNAPASCHIRFICKGNLIYTREGRSEENNIGVLGSLSPQPIPNTPILRSASEGQNGQLRVAIPSPDYHRVASGHHRITSPAALFSPDDVPSRRRRSLTSPTDVVDYPPPLIPTPNADEIQINSDFAALSLSKEIVRNLSPPSVLEGFLRDEVYDQIAQAMTEAENSRREAVEESIRRRKAEKAAIDAMCKAKASEMLYTEEMKQRKDVEEELAREKEEHVKTKNHLEEVREQLWTAVEQKSDLERRIRESDRTVEELEQKILSAVGLLQSYKKEIDELRVAEELRRKQTSGGLNRNVPQFYTEFSFAEIEEATRNFDPALKIGEGGYGNIFRGVLRQNTVAIKMLHSHSSQGPSEFQMEVDILSKLRHPNLITLIGACPQSWILVYEYLPNGSLEDRLSCKDNTPPLSWQTRIRIAAELCSVLVFLHSCKPHSIVHGDLKPANILLDSNCVTKLSDFGICRVLSKDDYSRNNSLCWRTGPKGTFVYMDPEFFLTGELTVKSDVYSFGIILLRLLTGRPASLSLPREVQTALDKGCLKEFLDPTAGDWPFVHAKQLARLGISCSAQSRRSRPDIRSDVWRVLAPMRLSCGPSLGSDERFPVPPYFVCPIFKEIMLDPVVAADGYTYEAEALKGWMETGHNKSPITNAKFSTSNTLPNRALRSAIQEWLQPP